MLHASIPSMLSMAQLSYGIRSIRNIFRVASPTEIFTSNSREFSSLIVEEKVGSKNSDDLLLEDENISLYKIISRLGRRRLSVGPVLDDWLKKGHELKKMELEDIFKALRKFGDYRHALEVSEWMDGSRGLRLGLSDFAIRLDMIAKVRGISSAE
ncbi:hypothetical protein KI387_020722, partial [Taxus chinensis]